MGLNLNKLLRNTYGFVCNWLRHPAWAFDQLIAILTRPVSGYLEDRKYAAVKADDSLNFFVVSCGRNTGSTVINCLQSVYDQDIARHRVRHLMVDDNSDDGTDGLISKWLAEHPDNNVEFVRNQIRKGGTQNTLEAFRQAPGDSILLELNADDWLPDNSVLGFLSKVYADPLVWMTYNSYKYSDNSPCERGRAYPAYVTRRGIYRDYEWLCQHLHTFRSALLKYVPDDIFIDPLTGQYFTCADDRSIYWSLLELCGSHSVHLHKTTYVYNFHDNTDMNVNPEGSVENVERIRNMPRFKPLKKLG